MTTKAYLAVRDLGNGVKVEEVVKESEADAARSAGYTLTPLVPVSGEPVADGYELVAVKNLAGLVRALDRAESKGYLPDAVQDDWEAFDYQDAQPDAEALRKRVAELEAGLYDLLRGGHLHFLTENNLHLKYLPIYADQPDPTYIKGWVWEVRDAKGSAVAQAHEWLYAAIDAALAARKEG